MQLRTNWNRYLAVVCLFGFLICIIGAVSAGQVQHTVATTEVPLRQTMGRGWLEYRAGLRVLYLQGTPYEMGLQHGTLLKKELQEIAKLLETEPIQGSLTDRIWGFFADFYHRTVVISRALRELPQKYREEMRGIAAGADIELETVLLLQYYFEALGPRGTSIVKFLDAPPYDQVLQGYNLEAKWPRELWHQLTVMIYKPHDGQGFVSIGWPGLVGVVQGMNQSGLALTYSAMVRGKAPTPPTISGLILMREALQHATYTDEVYATFASWPRSGQAIITTIAAQAEPNAQVIEYNAQRISQRSAISDHITSTAVFTSPALLPFSRIGNIVPETRPQRVTQVLQETAIYTPDDFVALLRDRQDHATGDDGFYSNGIANLAVTASTVFHPQQQTFWVAQATLGAPAPFNQYQMFSLKDEIAGESRKQTSIPASPMLMEPEGVVLAQYRRAHVLSLAMEESVDWPQIATLLEQVVAVDPAATPLYRLSVAYASNDRQSEAKQVLLLLLEKDDAHPYWKKRSLIDLGRLYESEHAYTLARATYQKALGIQIPVGPYLYEQQVLDDKINVFLGNLSTEIRSY